MIVGLKNPDPPVLIFFGVIKEEGGVVFGLIGKGAVGYLGLVDVEHFRLLVRLRVRVGFEVGLRGQAPLFQVLVQTRAVFFG